MICEFDDVLILSLSDETIHFIDKESGLPAHPSAFISGGVFHMQNFENKFLLIVTRTNTVKILSSSFKTIFDERFFGVFREIKTIDLTIEISTKTLSPIFIFCDGTIRFSNQRKSWTFCEDNDPIFSNHDQFDCLYQIETQLSNCLIYHESEKAKKLFLFLIQSYVECEFIDKAKKMIQKIISSFQCIFFGILIDDLLEESFLFFRSFYSTLEEFKKSLQSEDGNLQ